MKNAVAKTFLRPVIGGHRYSRAPTDANPPTVPTLFAPVPAATSISINWVYGIDADSGIKDMVAEISPSGQNNWSAFTINYPTAAYVFTGLSAGLPYDIRIKNRDNAVMPNESAYTAIQTCTTLGTAPSLEPGTIALVSDVFSVVENSQFSLGIIRTGAGNLSPAIEADWSISIEDGSPVPSNGTVSWAAGESGPKSIVGVAGNVLMNVTGTLRIAALRSLTGNLQPTLGTPSQADFTIQATSLNGHKWNPGHWGASNGATFPDDRKLSQQVSECNAVSIQPNVRGIRIAYFPSIFQAASLTVWDFSKIFRDLNRMKGYSTPKRLAITVQPQLFNNTRYQDLLPASIYNDSQFGASPIAGKYGFWTMNGGNSLTLAWWRPPVMNWIISLFQQIAIAVNPSNLTSLDAEPYFECTSFGETSMGVDAGSDFTTQAVVTQYQRLIDALNDAFAYTFHICQNNFCGTQAQTQQLTNYVIANHTVQGGPDIQPVQSSNNGLSWGQRAVLGIAQPNPQDPNFNGPSRLGQVGMMSEIQSPELFGEGNTKAYTPITLFNVANNVLQQSHCFWAMLNIGNNSPPVPAYPGTGLNTGTSPGNWNSVVQVINANPLTHIQKPPNLS